MGLRRRIESKVNATLSQARGTLTHSDRALAKAELAIDEAMRLLDRLEDEGIEIELEIAGRAVPVRLRIRPGADETEAAQVATLPPDQAPPTP